jgi:hypothetical protein
LGSSVRSRLTADHPLDCRLLARVPANPVQQHVGPEHFRAMERDRLPAFEAVRAFLPKPTDLN